MKNGWFERLIEAIEADPRAPRAISLAARCGPNYVQQMMKDGKEPGADRLARLLEVLGGASALYVLSGVTASDADLEMLRILNRLPAKSKEQALRFFETLPSAEGK